MNDNIDLLMKQATEHIFDIPRLDGRRFAEMIISECIKIATFKGDVATAKAIKEHFEIK